MPHYHVELDPQHLQRLGSTTPITGITELVWNALDADAGQVRVEFARNELGGVDEIRVIDDGHGMTHDDAVEVFTKLGGSWKRGAAGSRKEKRALHGRDGRGRFKAAGLAKRIQWETVAADADHGDRKLLTRITIVDADLSDCEISAPEETDRDVGTTVRIDSFSKAPPGIGGDGPHDRLTATFALYLHNYRVDLVYDGQRVDPSSIQDHLTEYDLDVENGPARLTVIEWTTAIERRLYLCDQAGTPLEEMNTGIQAPNFDFTAYASWEGFTQNEALVLAELDSGEVHDVLDTARDRLREHFKERARQRTREQIAQWKDENSYPYEGEPSDPAEQAARDTFDVVAITASDVLSTADRKSRRLSLALIKEALENDPGSLQHVLGEVLDLPQERLDDLSALLHRTPLSALISASKAIADRLDFLKGLEQLVLNPDVAKGVKERSQLHRILAGQTWVFGEEFALSADDESLTTVLKRHITILDRERPSDESEVLDSEGHRRIVDLMLARTLAQNRDKREHLVVELKAPKVTIGDKEGQQIESYATTVAADSRFDREGVEWDFIVVGTKVTGTPDLKRQKSEGRPYGQVMNAGGVRVWVRTWAEIIDDAQFRLKFVKDKLNYSPDAKAAIEYLRAAHAKYLPDELQDLDREAA